MRFAMPQLLLLTAAATAVWSCAGAESPLVLRNAKLEPGRDGAVNFRFDYTCLPDAGAIKKVRFFARRGSRDLYLGSTGLVREAEKLRAAAAGTFAGTVPAALLPAGNYELVMKTTYVSEPGNSVLHTRDGRATITVPAARGRDLELRCRISAPFHFALRNQQKPTVNPESWQSYEGLIQPDGGYYAAAIVRSKWRRFSPQFPAGSAARGKALHDLVFRTRGNMLEMQVDGGPVRRWTDPDNRYPEGNLFFRSLDAAAPAYLDDVEVRDLTTGKVIFRDDFSSGKLSGAWQPGTGKFTVVKGVGTTSEQTLGAFFAPPRTAPGKLASARVRYDGGNQQLVIDGKPALPLFFCSIPGNFPYDERIYDVVRNCADAGLKLFAPIVGGFSSAPTARQNEQVLDILSQLAMAAPDAKFFLRTGLPVPPALPESEKIRFRDGLEPRASDGSGDDTDNAKAINNLSLASDIYIEKFMRDDLRSLVDHLKSSKIPDRIIGFLATGGGYEGSWGNGGKFPDYLIDVSPAQQRQYRRFLRDKYGTVEALRKAWNDPAADFDNPPFPSLAERTRSDVSGFRSPANPASRRIQDFIEMYADGNDAMRRHVHDAARREAPDSFIAAFVGGVLNTSFSHIQFHPRTTANRMPGLSANVSIETYSDRNPGGVSISTNYAYESARLHRKMNLQELDLATPAMPAPWAPKSWAAVVQVLRREFACNVLMRQDAMWVFDMGYTGPWYDAPEIFREFGLQQRVGDALLEVPCRPAAEVLIVPDLRQWNYWGMMPEPLRPGQKIDYHTVIPYMESFCSVMPEAVKRIGASSAAVTMEDLAKRPGAGKLCVFPCAGVLTAPERAQLRKLAEDGAVCVFAGPAGLIDESGASCDNMSRFLGMKIVPGGIGPLQFTAAQSDSPLLAGIAPGTRLGGTARWFERNDTRGHRFVIHDPAAAVLGRYADGRPAMAAKKLGKGWIVYSGAALTLPALYRNLADLAGVHRYGSTDDMLYADGNYVVLHTRSAGLKNVSLRKPCREVREVFTGRIAARNAARFAENLPAGETRVYYIGDDPAVWRRLDALRLKDEK